MSIKPVTTRHDRLADVGRTTHDVLAVGLTAPQSIPNGANTDVAPINTLTVNTFPAGVWTPATGIFTPAISAVYLVAMIAQWAFNATGSRVLIGPDGFIASSDADALDGTRLTWAQGVNMSEGNPEVLATVFQSSGVALNLTQLSISVSMLRRL